MSGVEVPPVTSATWKGEVGGSKLETGLKKKKLKGGVAKVVQQSLVPQKKREA
jgi:hypothetical protein